MYVKLGQKAESFSDPISRFEIAGPEVKELSKSQRASLKTARAITGGHLAHASKEEFEAWEKESKKAIAKMASSSKVEAGSDKELKKQIKILDEEIEDLTKEVKDLTEENETLKEEIAELKESTDDEIDYDKFETKDDLVDHYKDTYEVDDDAIKKFSKLSRDAMVAELIELAKED